MLKFFRNLLLILGIAVLAGACDSYTRVQRSTDVAYKLERAKEYYNKGNYYRAIPLFEELISAYRGRPELEDIYYFYAYSHYGQGDFLSAAFHFRNYVTYFPNNPRSEEMQYMHAYSFYRLSPNPKLDQTYTLRAIEALQLFANRYPGSERLSEANNLVDEMRRKLEIKALNGARLYFDMGNFQAAAVFYENILTEYPDIPEADRVHLMIVRSYYNYARNSVESRKAERFLKAIAAYNEFADRYPNSRLLPEAAELNRSALQELQNIRA